MMTRSTPESSIKGSNLSYVKGSGRFARATPAGGHGRSGDSASQMCTCESMMSFRDLCEVAVRSILRNLTHFRKLCHHRATPVKAGKAIAIGCRPHAVGDWRVLNVRDPAYSILRIPASLITFAHCEVSDLMAAANSAGVLPVGSKPCSSSFLRKSGNLKMLTTSR